MTLVSRNTIGYVLRSDNKKSLKIDLIRQKYGTCKEWIEATSVHIREIMWVSNCILRKNVLEMIKNNKDAKLRRIKKSDYIIHRAPSGKLRSDGGYQSQKLSIKDDDCVINKDGEFETATNKGLVLKIDEFMNIMPLLLEVYEYIKDNPDACKTIRKTKNDKERGFL